MAAATASPLDFAHSGCEFARDATTLVGLTGDGDSLVAATNDPQICLKPVNPIAAGWCQLVLELQGKVTNPRVYFDFGQGLSETWAVPLEWSEAQQGFRAVTWLPAPVVGVRLDPSDSPSRLSIRAFFVDSLTSSQVADALSCPVLASPYRKPTLLRRLRSAVRRLAAPGDHDPLRDNAINTRIVFSNDSHLSGVSLKLDIPHAENGAMSIEVHEIGKAGIRLVRAVRVDIEDAEAHGWEHVYWPPIEDSKGRFFIVRLSLVRNGQPVQLSQARALTDAKPIHSSPLGKFALPQAVLFSPVTQCNLNCTHCISRPTRNKLERASEGVWSAVREVSREKEFVHVAVDYSGDILFNERKHGGLLSKLVELDAPFRIDTNANCLDDDIVDTLLRSRLVEINFSLDSMDADVYPTIRRGSIPLPEVLEKIRHFMRRKEAAARSFRTIVSFVLMRSNAATIKPALSFARDNGIDHVLVSQLIAFTPDMVGELFTWDLEAYGELYRDLRDEAARLGVSLVMQEPIAKWRKRDGHAPCRMPWGTATILGNGDVMACCVPGSRIGNINETSLRELWNGASYRAFREKVNTPDPPDICRNCPMSRIANNRKAYAPAMYLPQPPERVSPVRGPATTSASGSIGV